MNKQPIRDTIRAKNLNIANVVRHYCGAEIAKQIEGMDCFRSANTIAMFIAMDDEVPTMEHINKWHAAGKRIALPVINGQNMQFYSYSPDALQIGKFGIPSPDPQNPLCKAIAASEIDLMIVPGVAFTLSGQRLGRGGGFYDRYLANPDLHAITLGVAYHHQIFDCIPTDQRDIDIQRVVHSSPL